MRIILTIIFCALAADFASVPAQANLNNRTLALTKQLTDISFIEENQNQAFGSKPLSSNLELSPLTFPQNAPKLAAVNFITGNRQLEFGGIDFNDPLADECKKQGFDKIECSDGQKLAEQCPLDPSYYKSCCDPAYKYNKSDCTYPMTVSGDSCGGKYMCYCDKSLYSVTSCTAPQVVSTGDSCTEDETIYYASCDCPSSYSQTCSGTNLQGSGTGCEKGGVTKYTSCECATGYNMTCNDLGPTRPTDYCLLNGIKYFNDCKTCENRCTIPELQKKANVAYEYEECSKKYCAIGCATGYVNWCTKPETDCGKLGYTKSASQCPDGYLQCPYNAAAVFCEDKEAAPSTPSGTKCSDIIGCQECKEFDLNTNSEVCTKCALMYNLINGKCVIKPLEPGDPIKPIDPVCEYGWYNDTTCCTREQSDDCKIANKPCFCYFKPISQ